MITKKKQMLTAVLAAVLLCSGCSSTKKPEAPPTPVPEKAGSSLDGTAWLLESVRGKSVASGATVYFEKGQARGSAGCNSYSGPYNEGASGTFHLELALMTKRDCGQPETMQQEQQFTEAVQAAASFVAAAGKLTWQDAKGTVVAVFTKQSQELAGTTWRAVRYSNGQGGMTELSGTLTAVFGTEGQLTGFGGCNKYVASYHASAAARTFSFEMILMETKQCPSDTLMEQEGSFMGALYAATSYRIEDQTLTLRDAEGRPVLLFRP